MGRAGVLVKGRFRKIREENGKSRADSGKNERRPSIYPLNIWGHGRRKLKQRVRSKNKIVRALLKKPNSRILIKIAILNPPLGPD